MSKISNSVGRNDNFLAKARKLSILPTSLGIFDIRQHFIRNLYIHHNAHVYSVAPCCNMLLLIYEDTIYKHCYR